MKYILLIFSILLSSCLFDFDDVADFEHGKYRVLNPAEEQPHYFETGAIYNFGGDGKVSLKVQMYPNSPVYCSGDGNWTSTENTLTLDILSQCPLLNIVGEKTGSFISTPLPSNFDIKNVKSKSFKMNIGSTWIIFRKI